jgi:hypothetical protein
MEALHRQRLSAPAITRRLATPISTVTSVLRRRLVYTPAPHGLQVLTER